MTNNIVVIGAGVSGLTTALLLAKSPANKVTIVAKHMPGDYDIEYASPFAGANFMPMATVANNRWERRTLPELKRLTQGVPEAGIHFQKCRVHRRDEDLKVDQANMVHLDPLFARDPWYKAIFEDYRELRPSDVLEDCQSGCEFTSVCINVPVYLSWLVGQCITSGIVLKRAVVEHIKDAKSMSHTGNPATFIVNATGLGSLSLGGVEDATLSPARGQIVLVRNECSPMVTSSGTDDGPSELLYIMQRAAGGGTVLGGTYEPGNWDDTPDPEVSKRIMERAVKACPDMAGGKGVEGLSVIRHVVGRRPCRKGGVRIEEEQLDDDTWIVHNYGHASWGYQASYGCAEGVVEIVNRIRKRLGQNLSREPSVFSWDQ